MKGMDHGSNINVKFLFLIFMCSFRKIITGWTGFYIATNQESILVMLALLLRLVSITVFIFVFSVSVNLDAVCCKDEYLHFGFPVGKEWISTSNSSTRTLVLKWRKCRISLYFSWCWSFRVSLLNLEGGKWLLKIIKVIICSHKFDLKINFKR